MSVSAIPLAEARRIALAAQGFHRPRPAHRPTADDVTRLIRRLGLVQLDFVNVLVPAHYTVLYSRLGPYARPLLDEVAYVRREFTEQWAHEASLIPVECWPLLRHRMAARRVRPYGFESFIARNPAYMQRVLDEVRTRGPLLAGDLPDPPQTSRRLPESWFGTVPRAVLEEHFARGAVAIAGRLPNFARQYDLAERVIPAAHLAREVAPAEADRELLRRAAQAYGVATAADLADYWRMLVRDARPRLAELVETGELLPVRVEGWREPAYLHARAAAPPAVAARALLAPFDPLVWFRPRLARLFSFDYRFEIFVPDAKRRWGRYVMPFLLGDRLVARVDLKADRPVGRLRVCSARLERGVTARMVKEPLAEEMRDFAAWLGLKPPGQRFAFLR